MCRWEQGITLQTEECRVGNRDSRAGLAPARGLVQVYGQGQVRGRGRTGAGAGAGARAGQGQGRDRGDGGGRSIESVQVRYLHGAGAGAGAWQGQGRSGVEAGLLGSDVRGRREAVQIRQSADNDVCIAWTLTVKPYFHFSGNIYVPLSIAYTPYRVASIKDTRLECRCRAFKLKKKKTLERNNQHEAL